MLAKYKVEVERIVRGLEDRLATGDADSALDWLDGEMKDVLPAEVASAVKDHISAAWVDAAKNGVKPAQKTATQRLPEAMKWFQSAQGHDYGAVYNDFRDDMRKAVLGELAGSGADAKTIREKAQQAARAAGKILTADEAENRYRLVVSNAVNKARNFSQVLSMQELGFKELEIVAILDQKTSGICRSMNGRRVRVETMATFVTEVLETPPDLVVAKFPWPKTTPQGTTPQIISSLGSKMPPYHGRCRTTVIVGREERIVTRSGKDLTQPKMPEAEQGSNQDSAIGKNKVQQALLRWQDFNDLAPSEFASKINALQGASWGHKETLETKFKKHRGEFSEGNAPADAKAFAAMAKNVLTGYDRLFVYYNKGEARTMFYRQKENEAVVVDDKSSTIATFFRPNAQHLAEIEDSYVEIIE